MLALVGRGGMGSVYRVEQVLLRRIMALKTLDGRITDTQWRRFQNEARATAQLDHPNTVKVFDFGLIEGTVPYFAMELVEGDSLAEYIKKQGSLTVEQTLALFVPLCFALQEAHDKGIVHRDIKPSNIMLKETAEGLQSKLLDFGVARLTESVLESGGALTQTGEIIGSPLYMSPEQCSSSAIDHRSDIYSLGCTIFESLTGNPPLLGRNTLATLAMHVNETPPTLKEASLGKDFPKALESVLARMLEKNPDNRFVSMKEVATDLMFIQQGREIASSGHGQQSDRGARISMLAFAAVTAVLLLIGSLFWYTRIHERGTALPANIHRSTPPPGKAPDPGSLDEVTELAHLERKPFSEIIKGSAGKEVRVFHFPRTAIGTISQEAGPMSCQAISDVVIGWTGPLSFVPTEEFLKHPQLFSRFRKDEIACLDVHDMENVSPELLVFINHIKSIRKLQFRDSDLGDERLNELDGLPNLVYLNVQGTAVTADALASLRCLHRLTDLYVCDTSSMSKVFAKLATSKSLRRLDARQCISTTVDDIKNIAKITNLEDLNLNYCQQLSGVDLSALKQLCNLQTLQLSGIVLTSPTVRALSGMTNLKRLTVSPCGDNASIETLRHALPKCKVVLGGNISVPSF